MTVAVRASAEAHAGSGSLTATIPGSVQAGDLLVIFGGINNGGNATHDWSTPAGWTKRDDRSIGSNLYAVAYVKTAVSGDAGATVTLTSATTGKSCVMVVALSGVDPSAPIDVISGFSETTVTTSHATPTVTTNVDQDLIVIAAVQTDSGTQSWSTTSGYTKIIDSVDNSQVNGHVTGTVQYKGPLAVGTYGGETITCAEAGGKAATWTLAVSPQQTTQTARPASDVDATDAVGVPTPGVGSGIYADLAANDDAHYAEISNGGSVEVGFSALVDPSTGSGHTITYRARYAGGASAGTQDVTLKQGATTIATWTDTLTASFAGFSHTLTSGEANTITDYSALSVLVEASVS